MAHKKAAWSAKNLRDSQPKFRGVKIFGWQTAKAWNIIVRQCGNKYEAWKNVYVSNDFSIHASIDGVVRFSKTNKVRFDGRKYLKTVVNVDPCEIAPKAPKAPKTKKEVAAKTTKTVAKASAEKVEKKAPAKKATSEKKAPAKKPAAKKVEKEEKAEKKAPVKKATAERKAPAKKPAAKKTTKKEAK